MVVAVSGGVDSMVLLEILSGRAAGCGQKLVVAHFNHRLRGRSSDADERFVRSAAARLGWTVKVGHADIRRLAVRLGVSIEMAARQRRHEFLARTARSLGMGKVALAHQADDQAELFFLRLLRGAGPDGLSGMKPCNPSPADADVQLIRPLLGVRRQAIEDHARRKKIRYRTDRTNAELDYERNRVRHDLLPFLRQKYQPSLEEVLLRAMELLGTESDFLDQAVERLTPKELSAFALLHPALQRRWLRRECFRLGLEANWALIEHLRVAGGKRLTVGPNQVVWRDETGRVRAAPVAAPEFLHDHIWIDLGRRTGRIEFGGVQFKWEVRKWRGWEGAIRAPGRLERFDAAKVGRRICLRHWQPGDRFQPIGMGSAVKVQDLLTNLRVPRVERRGLVVAEGEGGEIVWIEGIRIGERHKVDEGTKESLAWEWRRCRLV